MDIDEAQFDPLYGAPSAGVSGLSGLGYGVKGIEGLGFEFRVLGLGFRVKGIEFRV